MVCRGRLARLSKRAVNCLSCVVLRLVLQCQTDNDGASYEPNRALMNSVVFKNGDRHGIGQ